MVNLDLGWLTLKEKGFRLSESLSKIVLFRRTKEQPRPVLPYEYERLVLLE